MASVGLTIVGSGTSSTRMSRGAFRMVASMRPSLPRARARYAAWWPRGIRSAACALASRSCPNTPGPMAEPLWRRAEEYGFDHAWTYDHLVWAGLPESPWFGALPTLTAAAMATSTIRLGTFVSSPNYRHPYVFLRDLLALDDISRGRLHLRPRDGGDLDAAILGEDAARRSASTGSTSSSSCSTGCSARTTSTTTATTTGPSTRARSPARCSSPACRSSSPPTARGRCGWRRPTGRAG